MDVEGEHGLKIRTMVRVQMGGAGYSRFHHQVFTPGLPGPGGSRCIAVAQVCE